MRGTFSMNQNRIHIPISLEALCPFFLLCTHCCYRALTFLALLLSPHVFLAQSGSTGVAPGVAVDGYDWGERRVVSDCNNDGKGQYWATISIRNGSSTDIEIVELSIENDSDGVFSIVDPGSIRPGFLMREQSSYDVEVGFRPIEEQQYYGPSYENSALIQLAYYINIDGKDSLEFVTAVLNGTGIEAYVEVGDADFGSLRYTTPGASSVTRMVSIEARRNC